MFWNTPAKWVNEGDVVVLQTMIWVAPSDVSDGSVTQYLIEEYRWQVSEKVSFWL